jgi:hypothetical protein
MGQSELECMASTFYEDLFSAQPVLEPKRILEHVSPRVMSVMNEALESPISAKKCRGRYP